MLPEVSEILGYWAKVSEYDPDQHTFSLGSLNYEWYNVGNTIRTLVNKYDENGYLACLYLKHKSKAILSDTRIRIWDILEDRSIFDEYFKLYSLLYSENMDKIEQKFRELCDKIISTAYGQSNYIGQIELPNLLSCLEDIIEYMPKCKTEIMVNSTIDTIRVESIHSTIKVFNTAAECILSLNSAKDNTMYLCYIASRGSLDGYFSYMVKSNGNIISINDRVAESYVGQHKHHRNGRWMEDKGYTIFPYESFVQWSGSDYKGYATKVETMVDELKLADLDQEDLIKALLGCILLMNQLHATGKSDMKQIYTASLMLSNIDEKSTALMVKSENQLVAKTYDYIQSITSAITTDAVMMPDESAKFCDKDNMFVQMYGYDFEFDTTKILKYDNTPAIADKDYSPDAEFLSDEATIKNVFLSEGREQLAEYIRQNMWKEFQEFGGLPAIKFWWECAVRSNIRKVILLCCARYASVNGKGDENYRFGSRYTTYNTLKNIGFRDNEYQMYGGGFKLNQGADSWENHTHICLSGSNKDVKSYPANMWFTFYPYSYKNLEEIVGEPLPRIIQGYSCNDRRNSVNSILDVSDPVELVGLPFEDGEVKTFNYLLKAQIVREEGVHEISADSHERYREGKHESYGFEFSIGFSKREFKKMMNGNSVLNTKYNITKEEIQNFITSYKPIES